MTLAGLKLRIKALAAKTLWAYGPEDLVKKLAQAGVVPGTTLVVHSAWVQYNGFRGKPADLVRAFKSAVGEQGLLVMTSMPYHNLSSAEWLATGKAMNVRRSPSMMGLVSEAFRRSESVVRSFSVTHPLLAWGSAAEEFVAGHENTDRPFGAESPFAKLLERDALILGFDAPFSSFTFTHFVEDQLADTLQIPLYAPEPVCGTVVDQNGTASQQWVRVLSADANSLRREHRLVDRLRKENRLQQGSIGHTSLIWIRAKDILSGAQSLIADGDHLFDAPDKRIAES